MGLGSDTADLLFRIKADGSQAKSEISSVGQVITGFGSGSLEGLAQSLGLSSSAASSLSGALGPVGAAVGVAAAGITAAVGAATALTTALAALTIKSEEYGSALYDAKIQTGLSAEGVSALKLAADSSGSSLEEAAAKVGKFNALVGAAQESGSKADDTLKKYGITLRDTNGAFDQAVKAIAAMTSQDQKAIAAKELFRDKSGEVLKLVDQLNGNFNEYIETAKKLGVTLTEADLKASDDLGDSLDLLGKQAEVAGVKFTAGLMPAATMALSEISAAFGSNSDALRAWGEFIGDVILGATATFNQMVKDWSEDFAAIEGFLARNGPAWANWGAIARTAIASLFGPLGLLIDLLARLGKLIDATTHHEGAAVGLPSISPAGPGDGKGGGKGGGAGKADNTEDRELAAQIGLQQEALKALKENYKTTMEAARAEFKETGNAAEFNAAQVAAYIDSLSKSGEIQTKLVGLLDEQAAKKKETNSEHLLRLQKQANELKAFWDDLDKDLKKGDAERTDELKKQLDAQKKLFDDLAKAAKKIQDDIRENLVKNGEAEAQDAQERYAELISNANLKSKLVQDELTRLAGLLVKNYQFLMDAEDDWFESQVDDLEKWRVSEEERITKTVKDEQLRKAQIEDVNNAYAQQLQLLVDIDKQKRGTITDKTALPVPESTKKPGSKLQTVLGTSVLDTGKIDDAGKHVMSLTGAFQSLADIGRSAVDSLAQGVGNLIQNLILGGDQGPHAMRKLVASVLAGVSAQAAVLAIMETAYGIAALTPWGAAIYGLPHFHFQAAALFGSIAVAAGVAGHAMAGDLFKQQTNTATGRSGSSASDSGGAGGSVYSSMQPETIEQNRNAPGILKRVGADITVRIVSTKDHIINVVSENVSQNGKLRTVIQDTAAG